jgi:soluble cytochrome b562
MKYKEGSILEAAYQSLTEAAKSNESAKKIIDLDKAENDKYSKGFQELQDEIDALTAAVKTKVDKLKKKQKDLAKIRITYQAKTKTQLNTLGYKFNVFKGWHKI